MRKQEVIINILLIAFGIGMIFWIIPAWTAEPQEYGLSGGTLPIMCCALIAFLATFQLTFGVLKGIRPETGDGINKQVLLHLCKYFVPMFCIIPLWHYVGFSVGSIVVLFTLLLVAGRRDYKLIVPLAVFLPIVIMLLLRYGLRVPTP